MDEAAIAFWDALAPAWTDEWPSPPLRPSRSDIETFEGWARRAARGEGRGLDALLLGLTRAIASMAWPAGTRLAAVDGSAAMIRHVWPRVGAPPGAVAIHADWSGMPLDGASRDFAAADCIHGVLPSRDECDGVHAEARRVLRKGGWFCVRTFLRPAVPESVEALFEELRSGAVRSLHLFYWRLAAALQGESPDGVLLHRAWEAWHRHMRDSAELEALAAACGWLEQEIRLIGHWRDARIARTAPSWTDLEGYARGRFEIVDRVRPTGGGGEHFVLVAMRAC